LKTRIFTITLLITLLLAACSSGSELPNTGNQPATTAQATQETLTQPTDQSPGTQQVPVEPAQATTTAESPAPTQSAQAVSCTPPAALTPALAEGPYWKQGSPERTNLLDTGITGTKLTLTGYVLDTECQPIANAWIDFWQTDAQGQYDNSGYTLRGHQYTDASGRYSLETIIPGLYPGRTEHIHVKVQAPDGPVLTTQLFFPDAQQNDSDRIFDDALVLPLQEQNGETSAQFNFIVPAN
jgi:protocatechuate 3,4-dioxygenase beta subunit